MTTTISKIALDKLVRSDKNIRRIDAGGTAEMAASILRDGLIQNLTVAKRSDGKYEVVAGARRLAALQLLVKQKKLAKTAPIHCRVVPTDEAAAISLAENQLREPMHPVDQLEAFKARIDNGDTITDVASRFGVTETFVKQRLKLASVAPELLEECRAGAMTLQQLQAFTVTDDTAAQVEYWNRVKGNYHASQPDWIKNDLLEAAVDSDDPRLKFIGRAGYQKAGGAIIAPDLFSGPGDDEDLPVEVISDPDLLERLAQQKLERMAAKLQKAEVLAFVEVRTERFNPYHDTDLVRATVIKRPPSPEIRAQIKELEDKQEKLCKQLDQAQENDDDDAYDALVEQEEAISDQLQQIEESLKELHPEEIEHIGAVIHLDGAGKALIERNIIRKEHKGKERPATRAGTSHEESDAQPDEPESASYSERLTLQLLTHKTAILRNEMMLHPQSCLAVIVYHMIVEDYRTELGPQLMDTPLRTSKDWQQKPLTDTDPSIGNYDAARENKAAEDEALAELSQLLNGLEENQDPHQVLFDYLRNTASPEQLMQLLSLCVSNRVDLRPQKNGSTAPERLLSRAFLTPLKINTYWSPTAENFFGHISKPLIIDAVTEAGAAADASSLVAMKKQEAAEQAAQLVAGTGWLPGPMRIGEA